MSELTKFSMNDMIVQNNLRADIPELFPDDYEKAICAVVVLMRIPEIGGMGLTIPQIAEKTGYSVSNLSARIYKWRREGIWGEVVMTLVSTMKADIQTANLSVLSHYSQIVGQVLRIITDPKVSPRVQLEAITLYMTSFLPKAESMDSEATDSIVGFLEKHKLGGKMPNDSDIVDGVITEVDS